MDKTIVCNVTIEGFHNWPNAPEQFSYLRSKHRHMFNIELHIPVSDSNREIEFIEEQRNIRAYIMGKFGDNKGYAQFGDNKGYAQFGDNKGYAQFGGNKGYAQFGGMSCEHIAEWLMEVYPTATFCKVIEGTNGGATLVRKQYKNPFCWFR